MTDRLQTAVLDQLAELQGESERLAHLVERHPHLPPLLLSRLLVALVDQTETIARHRQSIEDATTSGKRTGQ